MLTPLSLLELQISRTDQQLLFHLVIQQQETNRILNQLLGNKTVQETVNIDTLNRQELMKAIAKVPNNPKGWNKWQTEDMRKHLKGAS
jgi:glutamyl-tRNA reductase